MHGVNPLFHGGLGNPMVSWRRRQRSRILGYGTTARPKHVSRLLSSLGTKYTLDPIAFCSAIGHAMNQLPLLPFFSQKEKGGNGTNNQRKERYDGFKDGTFGMGEGQCRESFLVPS